MTKNIVKNTIKAGLLSMVAMAVLPATAQAKEVCFTQYGGGEVCIEEKEDSNIDVDKKVFNPETDDFEDHVRSTSYEFTAGEEVEFQVEIKNTGDVTLENVEGTDVLPDFLRYEGGDGDSREGGTEVFLEADSLEPGESETFEFTTKIVDEEDLPQNDKVCVTNVVEAQGDREDGEGEEQDADYANLCIGLPEVLGEEAPKKLPKAGAEQNMVLAGILLLGAGLVVNKKISLN